MAVIGLGYAGLPLALAFAEAGFPVIGIDTDEGRVADLNGGRSHVPDVPSASVRATVSGTDGSGAQDGHDRMPVFSATSDFGQLASADAAIICVPTPLSKTKAPDLSAVVSVTEEIAERLHPGMLIVLESTTYPGTTEEEILPRLTRDQLTLSALKVGVDFFLAFSPERIDPGRTDWTVRNTPKIVGGMTPQCLEVAQTLYSYGVEQVVPVSSPKVAEMVKLLENTFRAVNIALVNETAIMCDRLGMDVWEVIAAAKTKPFGFMSFQPGPGLGGHCVPIDPQYLAWKLKLLNYNARFIELAAEINLGMPKYVLEKISDALNEAGKPVKGSRVLVLGAAYKADVADVRESPSVDLIELLVEKRADVVYHDPLVASVEVNGSSMKGVELDERALQASDCVVVATAHSSYDWEWITRKCTLVVDTRDATRGVAADGARIVRI